jgi:hypothetical protein
VPANAAVTWPASAAGTERGQAVVLSAEHLEATSAVDVVYVTVLMWSTWLWGALSLDACDEADTQNDRRVGGQTPVCPDMGIRRPWTWVPARIQPLPTRQNTSPLPRPSLPPLPTRPEGVCTTYRHRPNSTLPPVYQEPGVVLIPARKPGSPWEGQQPSRPI